jgi:hypothetical protein
VALAPNGNLFVLNSGGTVLNFNVAFPTGNQLDVNVNQIAVAPNGAYYESKSNGRLWAWTGGGSWTLLDSSTASFTISNNGALFDETNSANLWTLQAGAWTLIQSNVLQYAVAQDGAVVCNTSGSVYVETASSYNHSGPYLFASNQTAMHIDNFDVLNTIGSVPGVKNVPV